MKKFISVLLVLVLMLSAVVSANAVVFQVDPDPAAKENVTGAKTLIAAIRALPKRGSSRLKAAGYSKVAITRAAEVLSIGANSLIVPTSFKVYDEDDDFVEYFSETYDAALRIEISDWWKPEDNIRYYRDQGFEFSAEPVLSWNTEVDLGMKYDGNQKLYYMLGLFNTKISSVTIKMVTDYLSPDLQDMFINMLGSVMLGEDEQKPIQSVKLNITSKTIYVKRDAKNRAKLQLKATVTPFNATYDMLSWSSSNEKVATVDQTGLVTVLRAGIAVIKARAKDGSDEYATCTIKALRNTTAKLTGLSAKPKKLSLKVGSKATIKITTIPTSVWDNRVKWSSTKESVATVKNGVVTARKVGTCYIQAKSVVGGKIVRVKVTVKR